VVAAGNTASFAFTPTVAGSYGVTFTVADDDGGVGTASVALAVHVWQVQVDPCDAGKTALAVGGTEANDHIVVGPGAAAGRLAVTLNGSLLGDDFAPTGRLLLYGQAGDDNIQLAGGVGLAAWAYGGAGDDRLKGGAGHDVLMGGAGADLLVGGDGRDLLIGGVGADRVVGNASDDILIAGFTVHDDDGAALCAIMHEWTSARDFATRRANINGGGTGERLNGNYFLSAARGTVIEDADADVLTGSSAEQQDWFFFDADRDRATDLSDAAFAGDLDFING
jgi:Ca2+-binding RTX toxin-like protein